MRSRLGLKALGLCALMVGVMAISASAAQAEGEWDVGTLEAGKGKNLSTYEKLEPEVAGELENEMGTLLTNVNGISAAVLCTGGTLENVNLLPGGTTSTGFVVFTGCTAWEVNEKEELVKLACTVNSEGDPNGTVKSEEGHGELGLHEGSTVTSIVPDNEETLFGTIEFGGCALPEEMPIYGQLTIKDCEGSSAEAEQVKHLIEEEPALSALYAINTKHPVTLDGSAEVFLEGAHAGHYWAALGP